MTFYLKSICIAILVCAIVCNGQVSSQDDQHLHHHHHHHHHHGHQHHDHIDGEEQTPERPSFKYSREANIRTSNEANPQQRSDRFSDHSHHSHDSHSHHSHPHTHDSHSTIKKDVSSVWVSALGSTLLISLAPYIILFFIPLDNSPKYESWLKVLLAFASGGLLGDAFLHLIPHAMSGESGDGDSHDHHHSHGHSHSSSHSHSHSHNDGNESEPHSHDLSVGLWVLAGIIVFLMVEKFVRIVNGGQHSHSHSVTDSAHERKHTQTSDDLETDTKPAQTETSNLNGDQQQNDTKDAQSSSDASNKDDDENRESETDKSESELNSDNTQRKRLDSSSSSNSQSAVGNIKISGYLNLAADFTHNLTDGLAIGASFLAGKNIGIVTTITILLHEIPHEIGDFAILIQSGCSRQKAMQLQLITAVGAFTGTAISLFTEGLGDSASSWILPFTAGGFIYIATVSVIPELLENNKFWQSVKELSALLVGISMMVIIARYE